MLNNQPLRRFFIDRRLTITFVMCLLTILANSFIVEATITESSATVVSTPKFQLGIRDSFMIAHSFHNHPSFGPAGGLHGATYTCDVEFSAQNIHPELNWVLDIGEASSILSQVLERYNYKNLDEVFGHNVMTTTEFLCRQIHSDLCKLLKERNIPLCPNADVCVKLWESHKAWARYTAPIS